MKIKQAFTSVAYPQGNGQAKVTNRTIIQYLQTRLFGVGKSWVEEVPGVLWAYRTTPRTTTGETPFSLVYGSEAVIPVEIGQISSRVKAYQEGETMDRARELDLIEEKKERAAIRMEAYRSRIMKSFNQNIKSRDFQIGDPVLKKVNPTGDPPTWHQKNPGDPSPGHLEYPGGLPPSRSKPAIIPNNVKGGNFSWRAIRVVALRRGLV
ncbi:uncharacterized protein [Henckelia pumila]|uniref:uncharacterized protein n=1 Tax=Henckelia pumila TaxID=405737 RepID=UPI003C6E171C